MKESYSRKMDKILNKLLGKMNKMLKMLQKSLGNIHLSGKMRVVILVIILVVALLVSVGLWYRSGIQKVSALSQSPFTMMTARVFRMPIAWVNGHKIQYTSYVEELRATQLFFETDTSGQLSPLNEREMRDYVLVRLLINNLTAEVAREYDVELGKDELQEMVNTQLIQNFESQEKAEESIRQRYGWSVEEFVEHIIVPTEVERKLVKTYLNSIGYPVDRETARARAQSILDRIKNGESFEALASEFTQDGTAANGGDLGWFVRGMIGPEFEEKAFSLQKGELASELVETEAGFYIMRVEDTRLGDDPGADRKREEVRARNIFIRVDKNDAKPFAEYMNNRLLGSEVKVVEGVNNPLASFFEQNSAPKTE